MARRRPHPLMGYDGTPTKPLCSRCVTGANQNYQHGGVENVAYAGVARAYGEAC